VRITGIGGDRTAGNGGWQNVARQGKPVGLNPVDAAGREQDGRDADAHPVSPGGAQQKTVSQSRRLEPAQ
jgi:hypothetical protein